MSRNLMMAGAILLAIATPLAAGAAILPVADVETGEPMALPTPVPDVPSVRPSASVRGLASAPAPASPHYAPAPNVGPVTGYGPGGMGAVPGAPANPPYSPGGLSGRR
jgi:hypothetical protein